MNGDVQRRTALILYGTETGNAQDLAEELGRVTERFRFSTTITELDNVPITALSSYAITIFVISTTGQGDFPSNAKNFWTSLLKKKLPATLLQAVSFILVGLGDTSYPKFNWAARKLGKRLTQLGASKIIDSCEADEQGNDGTDGAFLAWLPAFKAALLEEFPLPDALQPIPDEQPLPSKWVLERALVMVNEHALEPSETTENVDAIQERRVNGGTSFGHVDHDARPIPDSFEARLEENKKVTAASHWQDVRLLTLTTNQSIDYLAGDALSIMPKNFPEDVNTLLHLMDWTSLADFPTNLVPTLKPANLTKYPPCPISYLSASPRPLTIRTLLTFYLDITSIPRRSLFTTLSRYTTNPTHRDRLLEFTLPQYLDEYYDYATRARRSILEILQEFDSVKIPWQEAANVFPILRGRQFSIASGGAQRRLSEDEAGTKFELLVAIVKYKTVIKKIRRGVCTRYLAALAPGSTLNVVHRTDGRFSNRRQKQVRQRRDSTEMEAEITPKLLIGAGTGIAPLRALVHENEERVRKGGKAVALTFFFGSRNRDKDFFFGDEWTAKLAQNQNRNQNQSSSNDEETEEAFQLITAFSRDQNQKIYLQDRLREYADRVSDMIVNKKATVVVCGSSGAMPKAVRQALVDALIQQKNSTDGVRNGVEGEQGGVESEEGEQWTQEKAEQYLDGMEKTKRYLQETW